MKTQPETKQSHTHVYRVIGLDCPSCAKELEAEIRETDGFESADLDFMGGVVRIICSLESGCQEAIAGHGKEHGVTFHDITAPRDTKPAPSGTFSSEAWVTIVSGILLLSGFLSGFQPALYAAIAVSGYPLLGKITGELRRRRVGMNTLMTVASIGAVVIGETTEGVMVLFLFSIAKWLERASSEKARSSIEALKLQLPALAHVINASGYEADFPIAAVQVGEKIRVKPGEKIPLDGIVTEGESTVDESSLTGESEPVKKPAGTEIYAGTVNQSGSFIAEISQPADKSRMSRIMHSVQKAQSRKTRIQSFMERFAEIYTPAVMLLSLVAFLLPPVLGLGSFSLWFYRALVLLVIACPCALVLAAPVTQVSAMAAAARAGILLRGGDVLECTAKAKIIAFDKTGTLTLGEPSLIEILPSPGFDSSTILQLAASLEEHSEHPLAAAFRKVSREKNITLLPVEGFGAFKGKGVEGTIAGKRYRFGKESWVLQICRAAPLDGSVPQVRESCITASILAGEDGPIGMTLLGDRIRPEAREVVADLRSLGIERALLLSGDRPAAAEEIGRALGLDSGEGGLLPEEKAERLRQLGEDGSVKLMVGDGINDTPALAAAEVGVAMGTRGTDAALETAGVVLLHDDLRGLPTLLRISFHVGNLIRQNIALAIGLKIGVFLLTLLGISNLWMAVLADTGASVLVVSNGLRGLKVPHSGRGIA